MASIPSTDITNSTFLTISNNLSDVNNASTCRTNLGLGSSSTLSSLAFCQTANNLSDLANATTSRTNLGLGNLSILNDSSVITWSGASSIFTNSPIFNNLTASQYLKSDANKKLTSVATI